MQAVDAGNGKFRTVTAAVIGAACAVMLSFSLLAASVYAVCYLNPGYFEREYEKHDVLSSLPDMELDGEYGLMNVTEHMMDYLMHGESAEELQVDALMDGEVRGFFTEREIAHMWDVRLLFKYGLELAIGCAFVSVAAMCISRMLVCGSDRKRFFRGTGMGLLAGTLLAVVLLAVFCVYMVTNFNTAFIQFHHMFFDNDLWLLDPSVDMLVNIVPEGFFFDTATRIAAVYAVLMTAMAVTGACMARLDIRKLFRANT